MRVLIVTVCLCSVLCSATNEAVVIDGSSTVYPITLAVAEAMAQQHPEARIEVLVSGSSAGLRRLIAREISIAAASRPLNKAEREQFASRKLDVIEVAVAYDGLTIAVSAQNTFAESITVDELKRLWSPGSSVKQWSDLRPEWPAKPIALFSPGRDSGTFDYFTSEIVGQARAQREDVTASEDDNELVQGIVSNRFAMGYFGVAYVTENRGMLKPLAIDAGAGPVAPTNAAILSGAYRPLSRPLFLYVAKDALDRPAVAAFIDYYLQHAAAMADAVGCVPLTEPLYAAARRRLAARTPGSVFADAPPGAGLEQLLLGSAPRAEAKTAKSETKVDKPIVVKAAPAPAAAVAASASVAAATISETAPESAKPVPAKVAATAAPSAPVASPARAQVDALRDQALTVARLALDDAATIDDLARAERELRLRIDELAGAGSGATLGQAGAR